MAWYSERLEVKALTFNYTVVCKLTFTSFTVKGGSALNTLVKI